MRSTMARAACSARSGRPAAASPSTIVSSDGDLKKKLAELGMVAAARSARPHFPAAARPCMSIAALSLARPGGLRSVSRTACSASAASRAALSRQASAAVADDGRADDADSATGCSVSGGLHCGGSCGQASAQLGTSSCRMRGPVARQVTG